MSDQKPKRSLLRKSADPKWRERWATRNKNLANYLDLSDKAYSTTTEDIGSLWEADHDAAWEKLHPADQRSLRDENKFKQDVLDRIFPER